MKFNETMLTEGPGAGYDITVGDYTVDSITDISIDTIELADDSSYSGIIVKGRCNGKVTANKLVASSYYYSTEELNDVPAEFTWFEYEFNDYIGYAIKDEQTIKQRIFEKYRNDEEYDLETVDDIDLNQWTFPEVFEFITLDDIDVEGIKSALWGAINEDSSSMIYGGGYIHSTYDGQLTKEDDTSFNNSNLVCNLYITDDYIIEYIDKAVTGDNEYSTYDIVDKEYQDIIDAYNSNEYSLDDVIKIAEKYAEDNDINIEDIYITETHWLENYLGEADQVYDEIVWEV